MAGDLGQGGHAGGDRLMARALAATMLEGTPPPATVEDGIRACVVAFGLDKALDESKSSTWAHFGSRAESGRPSQECDPRRAQEFPL
jgi:hypothetical protein